MKTLLAKGLRFSYTHGFKFINKLYIYILGQQNLEHSCLTTLKLFVAFGYY